MGVSERRDGLVVLLAVWDVDRFAEDFLAERLDELTLVFGVFVRWTAKVAVREGWRGRRVANLDLGVIEFFLAFG